MNRDYELAMLTEPSPAKGLDLGEVPVVDETLKYEFLGLVKQRGVWCVAGQDVDCEIADVAAYIQCMDCERFNYLCRSCLDNRIFLKTLKSRGEARRVTQDPEDGTWTMEIAHVVGKAFPNGKILGGS